MTYLPLNLRSDLVFSFIDEESFWKRKCEEKGWSYVDFWLSCCNWKSTFASHLVQDALDDFILKKIQYEDLEVLIFPFRNYLLKLTINGFKFNVINEKNHDENLINDSLLLVGNVSKILPMFTNLEEILLFNFPVIISDCSINKRNSSIFEGFCKGFLSFAKLRQVTIVGMCLNAKYISCLIDNLVLIDTIEELDLSCCMISAESWNTIGKLSEMSNLRKLKLRKNYLANDSITDLCKILTKSKTLSSFDVSGNLIGDAGISSICESLLSNHMLSELDISYNSLTSNSGCFLRNVIDRNRVLKSLNISGNNLGEETGKEISKKIQRNGTLLFLGIQFCGFRKEDEDFIHLCVSCNAKS
ncbi:dynein regulatory complex subunit 5 [Parasteatoda tepidariorum]|uniref:dynein regulatory complex subunit 5 n=1 Tax=Parasteatoda tepidariorum TaxID=114398 RepID=UPI00077FABB1|nr:uncharacterized protein LOC107447305 [Parasteatoda tepidariorum]